MTSETSSSEQQDQSAETPQDEDSGGGSFATALAKVLDDEKAGDETGDKGKASGESSDKAAPKDLTALAAKLGVKVEDLYNVSVPASGGREAMTIGQIKDKFAEWGSLEADRLSLTETKVQQERELQQARDELKELISAIPKESLNKETLQRAAVRLAEKTRAEGARVLEVMPEWRDEKTRNDDVADITKMLSGYGLPPHFVNTVQSAGLLKFFRDASRREQQVRKALEQVRKRPAKPAPATLKPGAPRIAQQQQGRQNQRPSSERERFAQALSRN